MMRTTLIALCLSAPNIAFATAYYAAPTGSGVTCSDIAPCTVTGAISKMSSGDTVILQDGTYTGDVNLISEYAVDGPILPPSGTAGNFSTIRAEHVGLAIIDAEYNHPAVSNINTAPRKRDYVHFDGIHFKHGSGPLFQWYGDYAWISNCGFEDGMPVASESELPIAFLAGGSSYGLIEDNWIWGKGRYGFYTGPVDYNGTHVGTNHVIFRRNVVRIDDVPSGWMSASLRFYGSDTNVMQNNIAIDGNFADGTEKHSFATGGSSSDGDINAAFYGNIALNQPLNSCLYTEKGSGTFPVSNNICWGNDMGLFVSQDYVTALTVDMSYNTIGQNTTIDLRRHYTPTVNTTHDLFFTKSGASTFDGGAITTPEYLYLAASASAGTPTSGTPTTITTATQSTLNTAGFMYLPRLNTSSTLATATVGATVMYQIGGTGTFYGDTGWNTTTATHLWPYPNEAIWAAKMKAYTSSGPGGNRGFAALSGSTATPLTDYIWSFLGNPMTAGDIYIIDTTTPVTITNKVGRYQSSQLVTLTASETSTTRYCFGIGCSPSSIYTTPFKALVNLSQQTYCVSSTDASSNAETSHCYDLKKQRRR